MMLWRWKICEKWFLSKKRQWMALPQNFIHQMNLYAELIFKSCFLWIKNDSTKKISKNIDVIQKKPDHLLPAIKSSNKSTDSAPHNYRLIYSFEIDDGSKFVSFRSFNERANHIKCEFNNLIGEPFACSVRRGFLKEIFVFVACFGSVAIWSSKWWLRGHHHYGMKSLCWRLDRCASHRSANGSAITEM